jgi:hypothetical protein
MGDRLMSESQAAYELLRRIEGKLDEIAELLRPETAKDATEEPPQEPSPAAKVLIDGVEILGVAEQVLLGGLGSLLSALGKARK